MTKIIPVKYSVFEESSIQYDEVTLDRVPRFKKTSFTDSFTYTDERVQINILLAALASLDLVPIRIAQIEGLDFVVKTNAQTFQVETKQILTEDERETLRIQDMSAGLNAWYHGEIESGSVVPRAQVTFLIPSMDGADELALYDEMKRYLARISCEISTPTLIDAAYANLHALRAKVLVRIGGPAFAQISQGARSVEPSERALWRVAQIVERATSSYKTDLELPAWLIVWYQALYSAFSVGAIERLGGLNIGAFSRVLISDGRQIAVLD